jgi:hypothetical protein
MLVMPLLDFIVLVLINVKWALFLPWKAWIRNQPNITWRGVALMEIIMYGTDIMMMLITFILPLEQKKMSIEDHSLHKKQRLGTLSTRSCQKHLEINS